MTHKFLQMVEEQDSIKLMLGNNLVMDDLLKTNQKQRQEIQEKDLNLIEKEREISTLK